MFKKSIMILVIILSLCLSLSALASGSITFSDNLDKLEYNGVQYSRFISFSLYTDVYNELETEITLSEHQKETIHNIELFASDTKNVIEAIISYKDGSTMSVKFLQDSYLEEYNDMLNKSAGHNYIDFEWPSGNTVNVDLSTFGEPNSTLNRTDLYNDYFYVLTESKDKTLTVLAGALFIVDDSYYYVDFNDIDLNNIYDFDPYNYMSLSAYKIEDEALSESLSKAEDRYYDDGTNFLLNVDLTTKLSKIFFVFVFGIIPCVIAVIFLILLRRAKGVYKTIYALICATALGTSVLFTIFFSIIMHYN